jgi:hypothetical protein
MVAAPTIPPPTIMTSNEFFTLFLILIAKINLGRFPRFNIY